MNDLISTSNVVPSGWDAWKLKGHKLADGTSYEAIVESIAGALAVANESLLHDPIWGGMLSLTSQIVVAGYGGTTLHRLPIRSYRSSFWDFDYLWNADRRQLEHSFSGTLHNMRDNWEAQLLTRFFSNSENLVGSAGYDVPFVNSNGGNAPLTPPPYAGQTFADTHSHFDRKGTSEHADALNEGAQHLWEHGIFGPYNAIIPFADIATYTALSNFIKPDRDLGDEGYIGLYESDYGLLRLWITPHLPTNYLGIYKAYGDGNNQNPLRVRFAPDLGAGAVLMRGEVVRRRQFPLEHTVLLHRFGVGVGNRLNGYACHFAKFGDYVPPF